MATKEIWEITLDEYLAPYRAAEKAANDAYDRLYQKHCKSGEYPTGGNMWARYGHHLDTAGETTNLRFDPDYKRLIRARDKASRAVSDAQRSYEKAVRKALHEGKQVSEKILESSV